MLTELAVAEKVVGAKQVRRALRDGRARRVWLAMDADPRVTGPIAALCQERGVPVEKVPAMRDLGAACGISVSAAMAATL